MIKPCGNPKCKKPIERGPSHTGFLNETWYCNMRCFTGAPGKRVRHRVGRHLKLSTKHYRPKIY